MSDIAEGLGAAIEGSLAAKVVEPQAGKVAAEHADETECANCGAPLTGPYCNQCGQKAHVHRTLTAIGHDLMHGVLHLDGKLAHTLPLLAFKPGLLTRRYIEGERAKFVSPMAMLLFSVFAMFAVFQIIGLTVPTKIEPDLDVNGAAGATVEQIEAKRDELADQIAALAPDGQGDDKIRATLQEELKATQGVLDGMQGFGGFAQGFKDGAIDGAEEGIDIGSSGVGFIDNIFKKWRENPGLMLYKLQANGYKFSWLLVPISLPFVWLLFAWRRGHKAYDHAVFVTYSLSFMSLFFIALSLAAIAGLEAGLVFIAFATLAPLHLYKHLRYTYGLSRFSTLWRFFVLLFFMIFIIMLFIQSLILLGGF
ncbi:MAG: DUF3667 domain-containing protein [Pseudomonadota bacterium]